MSSKIVELIEYVKNFNGKNIVRADVRYSSESIKPRPLILILHGFTAFRRWGFFPYLGECFARNGAITVVMDFSHNGYNDDIFTYPERFALNTAGRELEDISKITTAIRNKKFPNWNEKIYLLGHSRGGGEAILYASQDDSIEKTAVWSCVATLDRFTARHKKLWRENGFFSISLKNSDHSTVINSAYLDDAELPERNILSAAAAMKSELLVIHGEQDATVSAREAQKIASAKKNAIIELIPQTGHTFGVVHPFTETTPALNAAIRSTLNFFTLSDAN